jgi:hypothetical protein
LDKSLKIIIFTGYFNFYSDMIFNNYLSYSALCERCFLSLKPLNKWRKKFFTDVLCLFLSITGKINFLQMQRYSDSCEQRYRQQFAEDFDFIGFNSALIKEHCSSDLVLAFDPSYIPKAGKKTYGKGKYWSGCAGAPKYGLEINGIAAIDLDHHTALHIEAIQTCLEKDENQLQFYAKVLIERAETLQRIANIVVVDAYFSKEPFVTALCEAGFHIVSRLRDDVRLRYIIEPVKTGKRGRTKTVGGKVDVKNLDTNNFQPVKCDNPDLRMYTAIVEAVALDRHIKVVVVQEPDKQGTVKSAKIFFSTDTTLSGEKIISIYQLRFQIEFLYRDAKQFTGLTHCQARDKEKLYFHFNGSASLTNRISLTAVSLAKAVHWLSVKKEQRPTFSMANIKTINHNALLLNRFIRTFGINPNSLKNKQYVKELLSFGTIVA